MGPTYTLDITSLVGPLQEITEFAHQLLILDLLPCPFLHRVASYIRQHQQHIPAMSMLSLFFPLIPTSMQ